MKASSALWKQVNQEFRDDLDIYTIAYNRQIQPIDKKDLNKSSIFTKAVLKHKEIIPTISELANILGNNLEEWIERGFLPKVNVKKRFRGSVV